MNFTTRLTTRDINIDGIEYKLPELKKTEFEITDADATIEWEVELEARSWGIKGIYVNILKLNGTITVEIYDDNGDVKEEKEIEFDLSDFNGECDFHGDVDSNGIAINDLFLRFHNFDAYVE